MRPHIGRFLVAVAVVLCVAAMPACGRRASAPGVGKAVGPTVRVYAMPVEVPPGASVTSRQNYGQRGEKVVLETDAPYEDVAAFYRELFAPRHGTISEGRGRLSIEAPYQAYAGDMPVGQQKVVSVGAVRRRSRTVITITVEGTGAIS